MIKVRFGSKVLNLAMTQDELKAHVALFSAYIKLYCGIANNAAWAACLEAHDHIKQHPNYRHEVKRWYKDALDEFKAYESKLVYSTQFRLFHMSDMLPEYRKRFGDINDREYYDSWASEGMAIFTQKRVWFMNLWNKMRIMLVNHGVKNEEIIAWAMASDACLDIAVALYKHCIDIAQTHYNLPREIADAVFCGLNISKVSQKWHKGCSMLEPANFRMTDTEAKNNGFAIQQLIDNWTNLETVKETKIAMAEEYGELFRTPGEQKKFIRQLRESD